MARPIPCDNGDDRPGAYVITNLADGSTFAVCVGCWVSLAEATVSAAHPEGFDLPPRLDPAPIDPSADPSDPDNDVLVADQAADAAEDAARELIIAVGDKMSSHVEHEQLVRDTLAARPDSAATSESVTWTPGGDVDASNA